VTLEADVALQLGTLDLDVQISATEGETVAVLGPNGAGKSTLLRALAGLLRIDRGKVVIDGVAVDDPSARLYVVPEKRSVGVVFQDYLLFPQMSVRENVAFGLRSRGTPKSSARKRADEWLARVGLAEYADEKPRQLSGGQAQRVALARALAPEPRLLLLDEPLAALDIGIRTELRRDLRAHLASFSGARILVTHELLDAVALADRIIVLEQGRVAQVGPIAEVAARPRSRYVADLVGVNLMHGRADGTETTLDTGGVVVTAEAARGEVYIAVHPHAIAVHRQHPEGSPRNVWRGRIRGTDLLGDRVRLHVDGEVPLVAEVTPAAVAELGLVEGTEVFTSVKATELSIYPA
jgi:molybdate transport system ATP-binding protein